MGKLFRVGLAGLVLGGCATEDTSLNQQQQHLASDATAGGTPGFYFLAPLGTPPGVFPGTFDGTLKRRLSIEIRDVDCAGQGTVGAVVQTYSTVLVYPAAEQYKVTHTAASNLYTLNQCYRILPLLDGSALGFVDIQVLPNTASSQPAAGYKKWGIDSQKAIAFRIEGLDPDADGVLSHVDNCPLLANPLQEDGDSDGIGDACEQLDTDTDGVPDLGDNCPNDANANQADADNDGAGDACDTCPNDADDDVDADGVCGDVDNCPADANADQADADNDNIGDVCDQPCANLTNQTGYWRGDGSPAASTGGVDAVFSGSATFAAGAFGQGFAFSGTNFTRADAFDQTGAFTVSLWAKADAFQTVNFGLLASSQGRSPTSDTFQIDWNNAKGYRFKAGGNTAPQLNLNIGAASLTAFQHIVVTYDGATDVKVYLDGVQTGSATWSGPTLKFSALKLGTNRSESYLYKGVLDDVQVFDRAITGVEVAALHAQPSSCVGGGGAGFCGDGNVQLGNGEQCDDGNTTAGDGCDATCQSEPFQTTPPVEVTHTINGDLSCTTAPANTSRKIAVDTSGTIHAVMICQGNLGHVVTSDDRGVTFHEPIDLSSDLPTSSGQVKEIAVGSGPTGVVYVAMTDLANNVYFRRSADAGATWSAPVALGVAIDGIVGSSGLSLEAFNDDVYVSWSASDGIHVARNPARGVGAFTQTPVPVPIVFFDLLYDVATSTLVVAADNPQFHLRASTDNGATFGPQVDPGVQINFTDWAISRGTIFVAGSSSTTLLTLQAANLSAPPVSITGLPFEPVQRGRSVSADAAGNAYFATSMSPGVQLDRLPFGTTTLDTPRTVSATGNNPVAGPLPGGQGVAVIYTDGTSVFITVQAF